MSDMHSACTWGPAANGCVRSSFGWAHLNAKRTVAAMNTLSTSPTNHTTLRASTDASVGTGGVGDVPNGR